MPVSTEIIEKLMPKFVSSVNSRLNCCCKPSRRRRASPLSSTFMQTLRQPLYFFRSHICPMQLQDRRARCSSHTTVAITCESCMDCVEFRFLAPAVSGDTAPSSWCSLCGMQHIEAYLFSLPAHERDTTGDRRADCKH